MSTTVPIRPGPKAMEAIEAEFMQAVYDAQRLARVRMLGLEPPPVPSERALALYRRARPEAPPAA